MRILILGGTGFIGSEVTRALLGHELWLFHRARAGADLPGVHHIQGDRRNLREHRARLSALAPDVVLDMGPQNGPDAQRVVETFVGKTGRIVAISSISVYRSFGVLVGTEPDAVDNRPCDEDAPLRRRLFPYRGKSPRLPDDSKRWLDEYDKIPAERVFLDSTAPPGTIVRLPMVYGPGDPDHRLTGYLRRMLDQRPAIVLHEEGASWRNSRAFVTNVGHAIARVVVEGSPGRVYNVADPDDLDEAEWIRAIGRQVGWTGTVRTVPREWSSKACPAIDELPAHADFRQHLRMDGSRLRRELAHAAPVDFDESLRRTTKDLCASPLAEVDYHEDDRLLDALERGRPPPEGQAL